MRRLPNVKAIFLPPDPSFLSFEKRALSARSRANRTEVLSYSCPLNDLLSPEGFFAVDSHLSCLEATLRRYRDGAGKGTLQKWEKRAREGTAFGNDIAEDIIN